MRFHLLLAIAVLAGSQLEAGTAAPPCLRYGPDTVSLAGRLDRRTYPGRPNYESIQAGDEPETGFYLRLARPICVQVGLDSLVDEAKDSVLDVQLVLDSAGYARLRRRLGSDVTLTGTLSGAITGHHHAPLLLTVLWPVLR